jgi:hypothetical protein
MGQAKVFIVEYESQCDHKVYLCDSESQQENQQIIEGGELVPYESQADVKVFLVDYESQAEIKITRENFPK